MPLKFKTAFCACTAHTVESGANRYEQFLQKLSVWPLSLKMDAIFEFFSMLF